MSNVDALEDAIKDLRRKQGLSFARSGSRASHIQRVLASDGESVNDAAPGSDRISFICACFSLAQDFDSYRQAQSGRSETHLTTNAESGSDSSLPDEDVLKAFVSTQAPCGKDERMALNTGVRIGSKARAVDRMAKALSLGSSFALLCIYEFCALASLPIKELVALERELEQSWATCNGIKSFSSTIESWWAKYYGEYQQQLSKLPLSKETFQDTNSL